MDLKCRPDEVAYAHAHNVPVPEGANDNPYSIDDNLWGRAIECGHLEDPWNEPLDDAWVMTKNPEDTPDTRPTPRLSLRPASLSQSTARR